MKANTTIIVNFKDKQLIYAENINQVGSNGILDVIPKNGKLEVFCLCSHENALDILHALQFKSEMDKPLNIVRS